MQQRAGLSGQIDPNLTQDAFAGNIAMQQRQQSQQSYGSPAPTQAPAASQQFGGQSDALSRYLAQASQTVANYKPEAVQGSGANPKGYTVTNSGLSEPDPSQFTSQADYQTALNAYAKLKSRPKSLQLSSLMHRTT